MTASLVLLLGGGASAAQALGRDPTLTGRTEIWAAVISLASNPLVGAGFESFWLSPRIHEKLWQLFPGLPLNEAHDGYIEVYLNLGWIGVGLFARILVDAYRRAVKTFRRAPALGGLLVAFVLTEIAYCLTEAGFRMLTSTWFFFLLAAIEGSRIAAGVAVSASPPLGASSGLVPQLPARNGLAGRQTTRAIAGQIR